MFIREKVKNFRVDRSVHIVLVILAFTVMVDYSVSETIDKTIGGWFYILPLIGLAPALIFPVGDYTTLRVRKLLLILYHLAVAILLIFFADIFGPYFQLLILLLLVAAAWQGRAGILFSLLAATATAVVAGVVQFGTGSMAPWYQLTLYIIGLAALGLLLERLSLVGKLRAEEASESDPEEVYLERTRLLSLINSMADAVVATDTTGKILLYNGAALELFDTNQSLHNQQLAALIELRQPGGEGFDVIAAAEASRQPIVRDDIFFHAADGSIVDLNISISPVSTAGSDRSKAGYILVLRDITKQKSLDEQRDEFISIASHELRTPIAIAEANISTAMLPKFSADLSEEGRKLLEQAYENVLFLSSLVNDLHVLAQAEKGHLEMELRELDAASFLRNIIDNYQQAAQDKNLTLTLEVAEDLPPVRTSLDAVREIMQNFITNALKYTESGSITLKAVADSEGDGVVFSVADTGIGISASDQKHIFEKFYRSEDYRTRQSGGTGLGLYITKRLIERMGGRLWFSSRLNKGSTFYCAIPKQPLAAADGDSE